MDGNCAYTTSNSLYTVVITYVCLFVSVTDGQRSSRHSWDLPHTEF